MREDNLVLLNERCPEEPGVIERQWNVRASVLVAATGAVERMLVFPNNDRPGVMLASANSVLRQQGWSCAGTQGRAVHKQ